MKNIKWLTVLSFTFLLMMWVGAIFTVSLDIIVAAGFTALVYAVVSSRE